MQVETGNPLLDSKIGEWLQWDKNEVSRKAIEDLVARKDVSALEKLLLPRLEFGTAGLRGKMGPGYAAMNDLVIIQTSQGLAKYLVSVNSAVKKQGVVIGFDARHNSHRFAQLATIAFLQLDIPVYLFSDITPTPFVPFTVLQLSCSCGIMVTASHNPKDDNGYKVYWDNGAQIIPPHDRGIEISINNHLLPWPSAWDMSLLQNKLCKNPLNEIEKKYYACINEKVLDRKMNSRCPIVFTYTAMHGVSHKFVTEAFKVCGFNNYVPVKEQMVPDPDFPTVKFPNPEEGKSALDLSFQTANKAKSTIILANDPDADRLAVAEKLPSGEWKVFTGNETGALLGQWLWYAFREKNRETPASDVYMISSTVSSKILNTIAKKEGFNFVETLTGFKWMANKACELMAKGKTVLFAFEEAIGYMCGTTVLDKDGVGAAMVIAELAAHLHYKGLTLFQQLENIYRDYGYHVSNNSYYICNHKPTIKSMFERLRNFNGPNTYPSKIGPYIVKDVRDLSTGYDSSQPNKQAILPTSSSSEMITFYFENGCVATLRTSGTEPKIKYYTELCGTPSQSNWKLLDEELNQLVKSMVEEWMEPEKNGLIPRSN